MKPLALACLALACLAPWARADGVADTLGEEYEAADPVEKLVLVAEAVADERIDRRAGRAAVTRVARAHAQSGADPEERLRRLGELRAEAQSRLDARNEARREGDARVATPLEPKGELQAALALDYVSAAAGPAPSLEELGCLRLVRESTTWTAHHQLVLALVEEAIQRDAAYAQADPMGKLEIVQRLSEEERVLGEQERKYIERAVLADWMSGLLAEGEDPQALRERIEGLEEKGRICFFSYSWADGILEQLGSARGEEDDE